VLLSSIGVLDFTLGALSSGSTAGDAATSYKPNIILLDVDLGDTTGFLVAQQLRSAGCPARIVFLSVHESIDFIQAAKDVGAAGYVFKSQIDRDLMKTLHAAPSPETDQENRLATVPKLVTW
jgi:two-component system nitrate/nitrite response regulator NarL